MQNRNFDIGFKRELLGVINGFKKNVNILFEIRLTSGKMVRITKGMQL